MHLESLSLNLDYNYILNIAAQLVSFETELKTADRQLLQIDLRACDALIALVSLGRYCRGQFCFLVDHVWGDFLCVLGR